MHRLGPKWTYGPNRIMVDRTGPMSTEVDRMNGIGPIWTEQNQSGLNMTNVNRIGLKRKEQDQFGPIGPNRTNVDQVEPKWTEEEKMDLIGPKWTKQDF